MATFTPTYTDQKWGQEEYAYFDYWKNDAGGSNNPLILIRHAGGGNAGWHDFFRGISNGRITSVIAWLVKNIDLPVHFDVASFTSGQRLHTATYWPVTPRTHKIYMPQSIISCQRAIAGIKHRCKDFGFDASKVVGIGDSFGASIMGLSMMAPPLIGSGSGTLWTRYNKRAGTHDSTLKGLLYNDGQISCSRTADGTSDYMVYSAFDGWFGTSISDGGTEFNNVPTDLKNACSLLNYFISGNSADRANYKKMFVAYQTGTPDTYPITDVHNIQQGYDLSAAIAAAGLSVDSMEYNGAVDFLNPGIAAGTFIPTPGSACETNYMRLYNYFVDAINS